MICGPLASYSLSNRNPNRVRLHSLIKSTFELLIEENLPPILYPERVFLSSQVHKSTVDSLNKVWKNSTANSDSICALICHSKVKFYILWNFYWKYVQFLLIVKMNINFVFNNWPRKVCFLYKFNILRSVLDLQFCPWAIYCGILTFLKSQLGKNKLNQKLYEGFERKISLSLRGILTVKRSLENYSNLNWRTSLFRQRGG